MKRTMLAALAATCVAAPALAQIVIDDAYARASSPMAKAGAAFMVIKNVGSGGDRLVSATSPAAIRVELHTHTEEDGVMRMTEVEEGFEIPADGETVLMRGGNHVMFMGLSEAWNHGDLIPVTLTFEEAGPISFEIPVDLERKADHGSMDHGAMGHGDGTPTN